MNKNAMFEKDLLYPTNNISEPGSIHVEIRNPTKKGKMPVIVETRTSHSPIDYIDSIAKIMQSDIFDRINVDIKTNVSLYFKVNDELKKEFADKEYMLVTFDGDKANYQGIDEIEI